MVDSFAFLAKTQNLVLVELAFVELRFESRDWRSLARYLFHAELQKWPERVDRVH